MFRVIASAFDAAALAAGLELTTWHLSGPGINGSVDVVLATHTTWTLLGSKPLLAISWVASWRLLPMTSGIVVARLPSLTYTVIVAPTGVFAPGAGFVLATLPAGSADATGPPSA